MTTLPITRRERKMLDERVKNKDYQQTPIGHRVKHWLEALQWEDTPQTTRDAYCGFCYMPNFVAAATRWSSS